MFEDVSQLVCLREIFTIKYMTQYIQYNITECFFEYEIDHDCAGCLYTGWSHQHTAC